MTLGDQASTSIPLVLSIAAQAIDPSLNIHVNIMNPTNYQFLPQYFGPDGDADGDGWSNKKEYLYLLPRECLLKIKNRHTLIPP